MTRIIFYKLIACYVIYNFFPFTELLKANDPKSRTKISSFQIISIKIANLPALIKDLSRSIIF